MQLQVPGNSHQVYAYPLHVKSGTIVRLRWARHILRVGDMRNANKTLGINDEGMRQLRPSRRKENNSKMDIKETGVTTCTALI